MRNLLQGLIVELKSPLTLLFDRPCKSVQRDLASELEQHPTIFVDSLSGMMQQSSTLVGNGINISLDWHDGPFENRRLTSIFSDLDLGAVRSSVAVGLHEHLQGGFRIPEIARGYLSFVSELTKISDAKGVVCDPATLLVQPKFFVESVGGYSSGGVFPVLATIDLHYSADGDQLTSSGLSHFSGQEILVEGAGLDRRDLMRRALRLAHDIAVNGAIAEDQVAHDLDGNGLAHLVLESDRELVRCRVQSNMD